MSFFKIIKTISKYMPVVKHLVNELEKAIDNDTNPRSPKGKVTRKELKRILLRMIPVFIDFLGEDNVIID